MPYDEEPPRSGPPDGGTNERAATSREGEESDGPTVAASAYFDRVRGVDLATTITRAVAEADGVAAESLDGPPLYHRVDADHLEKAMFDPRTDESGQTTATFFFRGYRVRVRGDGHVCVLDPGGTRPRTR